MLYNNLSKNSITHKFRTILTCQYFKYLNFFTLCDIKDKNALYYITLKLTFMKAKEEKKTS